ncbi:hypothetical protein PghCCS26_50690 [Paenibacillus glycanilyticus]|uniref:Uncharacterized protein n=1 Tax=Paenibacillus glycanilyticus TaxID=126569 RepID=A0ABQ6NVE6_9BACL|nr:hypothetical protein PghCCS26_50690 [Paenibacillus glycanilyticus]
MIYMTFLFCSKNKKFTYRAGLFPFVKNNPLRYVNSGHVYKFIIAHPNGNS